MSELTYNPIHDPFFTYYSSQGLQEIPLREVLLGNVQEPPAHPDSALEAFLRYVPSLVLQLLEVELTVDEWQDLIRDGTEAECFADYQERVEAAMEQHSDEFTLRSNQSGFYQHQNLIALAGKKGSGCKKVEGATEGLDGLMIHSASGNNPCHHKRPGLLTKLNWSSALLALMHHNYFCVAGLAGPSNLRGNQAYLCMIEEPNTFKRMIVNTLFPNLIQEYVRDDQWEAWGWEREFSEDPPSWEKPGAIKGKDREDRVSQIGLRRALLYTPRHAFFEVVEQKGVCDLSGLPGDHKVTGYYWSKGERLSQFMNHPGLAWYEDTKKHQRLPQNYNPSIWRSLGSLSMKMFMAQKNREFSAAPVIQQYRACASEFADEGNFTLDLQAYRTDKAKLLSFHHQRVDLPWFADETQEAQFYQVLEQLCATQHEMLNSFRYYGSADKNRARLALLNVDNIHEALVQKWGQRILDQVLAWQQHFLNGTLSPEMLKELQELRKELRDQFEGLCQQDYAIDDVKAQQRLTQQIRKFNGALKKTYESFAQTHSEAA